MKSTGIIRRVDDLGRISIPREIRRVACITEGSPMEISVTNDGIFLKPYDTHRSVLNLLRELKDVVLNAVELECRDALLEGITELIKVVTAEQKRDKA
jgi:AbrB family looped-hinge helix DNA binding protein